ncbi:MAG: DUF6190 family protein [Patescibacteria group bacterium]|jgi:hypothetical protein
MKNIYVDSGVFLAMHSIDEKIRVTCKNFFVANFSKQLFMLLEDVGQCDAVIWKEERELQDAYYPFMDNLHTLMKIERVPYNKGALENIDELRIIDSSFSISDLLTLSHVKASGAVLYTLGVSRLKIDSICKALPEQEASELSFEQQLERLYQESLKLRVGQ